MTPIQIEFAIGLMTLIQEFGPRGLTKQELLLIIEALHEGCEMAIEDSRKENVKLN